MVPHSDSVICDAIGDRWYHCCWLIRLPQWAVALGETVGVYFSPVLLTEACQHLFIVNAILAANYEQRLFQLLSSLHNLIVVPMVTIVGLYLLFKQRRPGVYRDTKLPHGSLYGMPSGDAMFSAMLGARLAASAPLFGALIPLCVAASRVARGFHTVVQVTFGAFIGCVCVAAQAAFGARFQLVSWAFALVLPMLVLFDKPLKESITPGTFYNLYSWVVCDLATLIYDVVVCAPPSIDMFAGMSVGRRLLLANLLKFLCFTIGTRMRIRGTAVCLL